MSKGSHYQSKQLLIVERPFKLMKPEDSKPLIIRNSGSRIKWAGMKWTRSALSVH